MARSYIHNYARTLCGKMHLKARDMRYMTDAKSIARLLVTQHWSRIWTEVGRETWRTRNNLACEGVGDTHDAPRDRVKMCEVHITEWIDLRWNGLDFIHQLAATSVVAAIADNMWEECERQRAADRAFLTKCGSIMQS